ncbi:hypothetical protein C8R44DRAFT_738834 [Mycena epipterygia]|nr:hypothetical protein C8R44DRAFT_738834 [Mycena epipterygia]
MVPFLGSAAAGTLSQCAKIGNASQFVRGSCTREARQMFPDDSETRCLNPPVDGKIREHGQFQISMSLEITHILENQRTQNFGLQRFGFQRFGRRLSVRTINVAMLPIIIPSRLTASLSLLSPLPPISICSPRCPPRKAPMLNNEARANDVLDQMTALVRSELDRLRTELRTVSAERDSLQKQLDKVEQARHDLEEKYAASLEEAGMKLDAEKARQALEAKCAASETRVAKIRADEDEIRKDSEVLATDLKKLTKTINDTTKRNAQRLTRESLLDSELVSINPSSPPLKRKRVKVPTRSSFIAPVKPRPKSKLIRHSFVSSDSDDVFQCPAASSSPPPFCTTVEQRSRAAHSEEILNLTCHFSLFSFQKFACTYFAAAVPLLHAAAVSAAVCGTTVCGCLRQLAAAKHMQIFRCGSLPDFAAALLHFAAAVVLLSAAVLRSSAAVICCDTTAV